MKIGIIGGGAAGLMAAWLLEQDHEVFLFESQDRLGGHIDTVHIPVRDQVIAIEAGFEFFSEPLFPVLCQLLKILDVEARAYPLTYTFYNPRQMLVLPPFAQERISWKALAPNCLFTLLQYNYLLNRGKDILKTHDTSITMEEFARSTRVSNCFKDNFLFPFYAGAWGAEIDDLKKFAAYDVLNWSLKNKPAGIVPGKWLEIVGGACTYIHALAAQLHTTHVHLSTKVTALTFDNNGYGISDGVMNTSVDHLIIATNALEAKKLLNTLAHAESRQQALSNLDYFHTLIAVHGDEQWMPKNKKDWSVANIFYDGGKSSLTVYKPRIKESLFRSWIMHKDNSQDYLPKQLYALREYYHAKVNVNYFATQKTLQKLQGINNLWTAGLYMHGIDSHDSALMSAISIAQKIAPSSMRLGLIKHNV